ncbi:MAG: DJ-1/PfpI family protein [Alphaproteobacteria bacterium]|jgi:putative intracellular protease/amidase|nr:DJ-1/PfpI family protein [Alphaproteobacteria bacterium]
MDVVVLIFDDLTTLDAIGPLEVLARLPEAKVRIVAKTPGTVRAGRGSGGLGLVADAAIADIGHADILLVPGGFGAEPLCEDKAVLDWLRALHETTTWTTSVCTGSLLLGAAGLLEGLPATTHWAAMERLAGYGALPRHERVVSTGKIVTAAGVSAGIDMALHLAEHVADRDTAEMLQLQIEYDPQPPFDSGSIAKAPAAIRTKAEALSRKLRETD